jgi:O-acetyl-ADP-ribose deacetylase (regulator of RNase III)
MQIPLTQYLDLESIQGVDGNDTSYSLRHKVLVGEIGAIAKRDGPWLAVISSDDNYLSHAGGSARDIWQSAGVAALNQSVLESLTTPVQVGTTVETSAGALPARAVLHAITLDQTPASVSR